jgi:dihydrofolate reductase
MNAVTLDGVMQGPGRPDEDTRNGFAHGGWAVPYSDHAMVAKMGERMGEDRAWLFGRRTYEDVLATWNARGGQFKDALNDGRNLVIMGSGVLIGSLMAADVIDEYLLMIVPVVLGTGRRLFAGGARTSLRLVESVTTSTGVVICTYQRARG